MANQVIEFAIELLPAHTNGLDIVLKTFGVDSTSVRTHDSYVEPHLIGRPGKQAALSRKPPQVPVEHNKSGQHGLINVCRNFMHASLVFVNPPKALTLAEAEAQLQGYFSARFQVLVDTDPLKIEFAMQVEESQVGGNRSALIIKSKDGISQNRLIDRLCGQISDIFTSVCWKVRRSDDCGIHMTIRDERYETKRTSISSPSKPKIPRQGGYFHLVFDKFAVTPAARSDARHNFGRQLCGATLCLNIFSGIQCVSAPSPEPKCFLHGTHFFTASGEKTAVEKLERGEVLLAHDGTKVEVSSMVRHEAETRALVRLCVGSRELLVTSDHPVMVTRGRGDAAKPQAIAAGSLNEGHAILCSDGEQVISFAEECPVDAAVFEIQFRPNLAMGTVYIAGDNQDNHFLTKGTKANVTRRSGMNRPAPNANAGESWRDLRSDSTFDRC